METFLDTPPCLQFVNPATGEPFGEVSMATPEDASAAISELRQSFKAWNETPVRERARILGKFQQLVVDEMDAITATITQDTGKPRQDALSELFMSMDLLSTYRRKASGWLKPQTVSSGLYVFKKCLIEPRPFGVVLVIGPWNYPFYLTVPPIFSALLAGNTVVFKPSEVAGATGVMIEKLFQIVPELRPLMRVLHGDGEVGAEIIQAAPDFIFFTGSTATGQKILQAAADHLIPTNVELGGKDATIVLEDADIREAARWSVWGACYNTGQTCISVERVYVVESVYEEFVRQAVTFSQELKQGYSPELDNPNHIGPISDPRQLRVIEDHMADALAKGAQIETGGHASGMFYPPTVLTNVDHTMLVMQEETFGPLLPVMKVKDETEAIRLANDNRYGLGASVWSNNLARGRRVARQLQAGSIMVNDTAVQIAIPSLPFGGVKHSGSGRIHGKEGLLRFTTPITYAISRTPFPWDLATIMRIPGHYWVGQFLMELLFGVTLRQRLRPLLRWLKRT